MRNGCKLAVFGLECLKSLGKLCLFLFKGGNSVGIFERLGFVFAFCRFSEVFVFAFGKLQLFTQGGNRFLVLCGIVVRLRRLLSAVKRLVKQSLALLVLFGVGIPLPV